jgi:hypothetical protein
MRCKPVGGNSMRSRKILNEHIRGKKIKPMKVTHRIHQDYCRGCGCVIKPNRKPSSKVKVPLGLCGVCSKDPAIRPKCKGTTKKGQPCKALATYQLDLEKNEGYCIRHDPKGDWDFNDGRISRAPFSECGKKDRLKNKHL